MNLTSNHPFWPLNSGLIRSYPSLKTDLECEVLVLGAGITGALCAYQMIKAGMDVVVLDKRDVASGSTSASTAMLQYEIDTPLTDLIASMGKADAERAYQVCLESIGKIATLCDEIGDSCGFTWKSSAYLASRKKDVPGLQAEYAALGKKAAKLEKRFREMFPAIDLQLAYTWAGTFGETKDGLAYIGAIPELPRCFFTLGFGGNGITYSVIAGEIVRDAIQGKTHPDARLFRFDR